MNNHVRKENLVGYGNIFETNFKKIWASIRYTQFRTKMQHMEQNIPWCGDCPFSLAECFYTQSNAADCWSNDPGCHECLYSMGLIKCLVDENDFEIDNECKG